MQKRGCTALAAAAAAHHRRSSGLLCLISHPIRSSLEGQPGLDCRGLESWTDEALHLSAPLCISLFVVLCCSLLEPFSYTEGRSPPLIPRPPPRRRRLRHRHFPSPSVGGLCFALPPSLPHSPQRPLPPPLSLLRSL